MHGGKGQTKTTYALCNMQEGSVMLEGVKQKSIVLEGVKQISLMPEGVKQKTCRVGRFLTKDMSCRKVPNKRHVVSEGS